MPDPERPEGPGGYDPVGPRPREAISPTGQGGPMDLALDEAESLEGVEKTRGPAGGAGPGRRRARCGPTPGTSCAATRSSSSPR